MKELLKKLAEFVVSQCKVCGGFGSVVSGGWETELIREPCHKCFPLRKAIEELDHKTTLTPVADLPRPTDPSVQCVQDGLKIPE